MNLINWFFLSKKRRYVKCDVSLVDELGIGTEQSDLSMLAIIL